MKKLINLLIKINKWFNFHCGWFFTNGRKQNRNK